MRFNCGKSRQQRCVEHAENTLQHVRIIRTEWTDKFAWWPVRVGEDDCRWLETIQVRYPDAYIVSGFITAIYLADHQVKDIAELGYKVKIMYSNPEYRGKV